MLRRITHWDVYPLEIANKNIAQFANTIPKIPHFMNQIPTETLYPHLFMESSSYVHFRRKHLRNVYYYLTGEEN